MPTQASLLLAALCVASTLQLSLACYEGEAPSPVTVGESTTLCLRVNDNKRMAFTIPKVDTFSLVSVKGSAFDTELEKLATGHKQVFMSVTAGNAVSVRKAWKFMNDAGNTPLTIVPYFTAIVEADMGVIKTITYDEGCFSCIENDAQQCAYNTVLTTGLIADATNGKAVQNLLTTTDQKNQFESLYMNKMCRDAFATECTAKKTKDPYACDLKVYVVWMGSDKNGAKFTSAGQRFSRFQAFSIGNAFATAKSGVMTAATDVKGAYDAL